MSSTILSSLGEAVLHRNSIATVTENWIVVREVGTRKQVLLSADSISDVKHIKTLKLPYVASGVGAVLIALATASSKESYGATTLLFGLLGAGLLLFAHFTRRASLAFSTDRDTVQTAFGTLSEVATLLTAIRCSSEGKRRDERPVLEFFRWLRSYICVSGS